MSRRRYDGYRGRSAARSALHTVLCLLVVVLLLALAGLIIGQRYLVYTDDGVRLELPFFRQEKPVAGDMSVSVDIVGIPEDS